MGINDITTILDRYGTKGGLFVIFLFLFFSMLKSSWFSSVLSKISDSFVDKFLKRKSKDHVKMVSESDITNHDIFNFIDFWVHSKIPTIQFSTEYRTAVFRKYLTIFLQSYKNKINEFVSYKTYQNMDDSEVWRALLNLINQIVQDYETEMLNVGIPSIIVDKMKSKNNETITLTIDLIDGVCNSQFYDSEKNLLKVYSILNILLSVLENTVSGSESVCNSINGSLKGLKFNGKTEP